MVGSKQPSGQSRAMAGAQRVLRRPRRHARDAAAGARGGKFHSQSLTPVPVISELDFFALVARRSARPAQIVRASEGPS